MPLDIYSFTLFIPFFFFFFRSVHFRVIYFQSFNFSFNFSANNFYFFLGSRTFLCDVRESLVVLLARSHDSFFQVRRKVLLTSYISSSACTQPWFVLPSSKKSITYKLHQKALHFAKTNVWRGLARLELWGGPFFGECNASAWHERCDLTCIERLVVVTDERTSSLFRLPTSSPASFSNFFFLISFLGLWMWGWF